MKTPLLPLLRHHPEDTVGVFFFLLFLQGRHIPGMPPKIRYVVFSYDISIQVIGYVETRNDSRTSLGKRQGHR